MLILSQPQLRLGKLRLRQIMMQLRVTVPLRQTVTLPLQLLTPACACPCPATSCWARALSPGRGTDTMEGLGAGMLSQRSPIYASDHRAVVVDLTIEGGGRAAAAG